MNTIKSQNHLQSFQQVKSFINQSLLKQSFKKYVDRLINQNAQKKISPSSVDYVNNVMCKLVTNSILNPNPRTSETEQICPNTTSDIFQVKLAKKSTFNNSSINFGNNQFIKRRKSSRFFKDHILQSTPNANLSPLQTNRSVTSSSNHFGQNKHLSKVFRHKRTSTQINVKNTPEQRFLEKQNVLLPLVQNQSNENLLQNKSFLNRELDYHIESLRNRKIKLEAAFSCFDQEKGHRQNMESDKNNTSKFRTRKDIESQLKCIVTDYDGQIITTLPAQKLRKINSKNKENMYKTNFTPIIRIKTQVCSNYLELQQNQKSFKPSRKYIHHKGGQSLAMSSHDSDQIQRNKSKPSICSMQNNDIKGNESIVDYKKRNFAKERFGGQSLFNVDELSKSRRMIQKGIKSQKKIFASQT